MSFVLTLLHTPTVALPQEVSRGEVGSPAVRVTSWLFG